MPPFLQKQVQGQSEAALYINGYMRPKVISNKAKKINCLNDIIIIVYRVFLQLIGFFHLATFLYIGVDSACIVTTLSFICPLI